MNSLSPDVKAKENEREIENPRTKKSLREQKSLKGLMLRKRMEEWRNQKSNPRYEAK